jgi:hypothetical protein
MFERGKRADVTRQDAGSTVHVVPGRKTLSEQIAAPPQYETQCESATERAPSRRALDAGGGSQTTLLPARREISIAQLFPGAPAHKALDRDGDASDFGPPKKNGPDGDELDGGLPPGGAPEPQKASPPVKKKTAGVESFTVEWAKGTIIDPTAAKLRLDYNAKFKKDDDHDPALAEFRQNAGDQWEITDGPHKGAKGSSPLADDNYSRADDLHGNKKTDQLFYSNDNPGWGIGQLDKDDVLDYAFTAEQMIIDTSDGNKVIAKHGPHTATIKGKSPRVHGNVPKKFG